MVRDLKVEQFVHDNELLETIRLIEQLRVECDATDRRARRPFALHSLDPNLFRARFDLCGPTFDGSLQLVGGLFAIK